MGERKVLQKYYPPDFDWKAIPKGKKPKNQQIKVRMMLPMSIRCSTCGEFMGAGKKFNSRKEIVVGEDYHGIKIHRFYIKCTRCSSEMTMKTDPKNADYTCEVGMIRNFEPWKANEELKEQTEAERQAEEEGDIMKQLENRTLESKREMAILDALDDLQARNSLAAKTTTEELLQQHRERHDAQKTEEEQAVDDEDEAAVRAAFGASSAEGNAAAAGLFVRRLSDSDSSGGEQKKVGNANGKAKAKVGALDSRQQATSILAGGTDPTQSSTTGEAAAAAKTAESEVGIVGLKRKPQFAVVEATDEKKKKKKKKKKKEGDSSDKGPIVVSSSNGGHKPGGALGGLVDY